MMPSPTAIFLIACKDVPGIVSSLTSFILNKGGNLLDVDFHTDPEESLFLGRLEWLIEPDVDRSALGCSLDALCASYDGSWELHFSDVQIRVAVFASKQDHCLLDLLLGSQLADVNASIALVVANHDTLRDVVEARGTPFHHVPVTKATKSEAERIHLELLDRERIDLVVLAKYMQILSADFLSARKNVINIHHSFLPAFVGAKPYHQAHARGVKIIGATAHFATVDLDCGPIIEQE
ncbi:hypothetical protein HKX48_001579, partial [Thoreauomyces humboldtii]